MPPSMQTISNKGLTGQKIAAQLKQIQENEGLWHSFIVFLGALFLLGAIPFYPVYIDFILAGICGIIAYKTPWAGTLLSMLFAFPAIAYQSAVFGLAFMLLIALVLFTMFGNWLQISWVQILTMAPFSFGNLPFFGWITILGMAIGAMHFGSRRSILISIPSVMLIIFLSAIWVIPNNAFLPVNLDLYKPGDDLLKINKGLVEIEALPSAIASSLGSLFSYEKISNINSALGTIIGTILKILFNDTGILQLIGWSITLYAVAYLSGQRGKWAQTIASLALIIPVAMYYAFSLTFAITFKTEVAFAALSAIIAVAILDYFNVKISREEEVRRAERTASFGKFGLQDLAVGSEEKSMDDIGGYEDVKQELRDAILMPLERKELAYTYGIKPPSGILLFGPPGTGKTMLMRALAKELKYGFYYIKASDILSQWFGESLVGSEKLIVKDENGNVKHEKIGQIVEKKLKLQVLSFDEDGEIGFKPICGYIKHKSTSPIYEIKTYSGRRIKVTSYHSLFTLVGNKIESVETSKLIAGISQIAVPKKITLSNLELKESEFLELFKHKDDIQEKSSLIHAKGDIYLDRVEEIKRIEDEEFVYDISVEPGQNFVAGFGGIFAHNSEKNVSEIFKIARAKAPSILFFDEIDSIGKKRGSYSTDEVTPRVLSVLLQEIDGAKTTSKPVMIVGATNIPDQLDAALLRPGRFDKIIYMHLPDREARKEILKVHLKKVPLADNIDFDKLVAKTERFSGADLKNVCKEAINQAAKEAGATGKIVPISMQHIMSIVQSVKPRTSLASLENYNQFKLDFERRVGGKQEEQKEEAIHWEDVAGLSQVKQALLETIELPLLHEAEMKELKVKPSKGILLFGPPGTGKTLIVKAASNELKASFQSLSAAELMKQGYTQAVTIIKDTFNRARENTPAIIFVDEIETFAPARGVGSSEILGQFLTEMDGMRELKGVVVMAATNKPALLDPAILRPGRFDKIFYIPPPSVNDRAEIFKIHLSNFGEKLDAMSLAQATPGFSGADIASICQDYKMEALRAKIAGQEFVPSIEDILEIAKTRRPSITKQLLDEYAAFLEAYGERGAVRRKKAGDDNNDLKREDDGPDLHYR